METIEKSNSYYTKREVDRQIEKMVIVMSSSLPKTNLEKLANIVSLQEIEISNLKERIKILEEKKAT